MGIATTTLEMRSPEEHRERLHEIVKAASTVMVLSRAASQRDARGAIEGQPMRLVRTADDTTMYVAAWLEAEQADELERAAQVTVVVPGACFALITAEARICRDRPLLDELGPDLGPGLGSNARRHSAGAPDPTLTIVVLLPFEGSYWDAGDRHSYVYRLLPQAPRDHVSDGIPVEL
ncbi:MAG TPA: pyridoxamine 5'-phosphate oxidase family protein [Kofleriaceae bacterium]|nr:pyridoxamine 5'-phosphate oxidase family protein [Kofleriaceae bacterium]